MSLALSVLDGPLKGQTLLLKKDFIFSGSTHADEEMGSQHAKVEIDQNISWNISSLGDHKIRVGLTESARISLILGLIFHLGQTGFKVIEMPQAQLESWEEGLTDWLTEQTWPPVQAEFFFFLYPVRLTFLSGPQADEFYTISYGPRILGYNQFDLNIKDPKQPKSIVKFFQIGETVYIENLTGGAESDQVFLNKNRFDQHAISDKDLLQFGSHVIELTILK